MQDGGLPGHETRGLLIRACTLKQRYGNGVPSFEGGSSSRLAIAVVDAIDVKIADNLIYGTIDLEPNLDGQHLVNILVSNNQFLSGHVDAQAKIGNTSWYDEPFIDRASPAASVLPQGVNITGSPGSPTISNVVVMGNTFERGVIRMGNIYIMDVINNVFEHGLIVVGDPSGSNYTHHACVKNNVAKRPCPGERCFIKLDGQTAFSEFSGNTCEIDGGYCIGFSDRANDYGRNYYANNINCADSPKPKGIFGVVPQTENHFYCTNPAERNAAIANGWVDEGIEAYVLGSEASGTKPLFRLYNPQTENHFYCTTPAERDAAIANGWVDEGIEAYVLGSEASGTKPLFRLTTHTPNTTSTARPRPSATPPLPTVGLMRGSKLMYWSRRPRGRSRCSG